MEVIKTILDGVVVIEPRLFEDARGSLSHSPKGSLMRRSERLSLFRTTKVNPPMA